MDPKFKESYKGTIKEVIAAMGPEVKNKADVNKEYMVLLRYIFVCQNPFNEFVGPDTDFNLFYEGVENCPPEKLRE